MHMKSSGGGFFTLKLESLSEAWHLQSKINPFFKFLALSTVGTKYMQSFCNCQEHAKEHLMQKKEAAV